MFERIKEIFSNINFSDFTERIKFHKTKKNSDAKSDEESGGKLYAAWLFVIPVISGFILGRLASVGLGFGLGAFTGNAGVVDAAVTEARTEAAEREKQKGLEGFLASNPFHISPQKPVIETPKETPKEPEPEPEPETELEDLILRGTLPGIGAWVENKGTLTLILLGDAIEKYRLKSVLYNEALFTRGKKSVTKYISYGPMVVAEKKTAPAKAAAPKAPEPAQTGNVVAAAPGGQEGQVSSETVQQLVQNPFEELKRIRIRPSETAGGLEVQWIQNDSILKRLGVQKGDVIRSVNGIPFTNMGDIANSINSLMNSERFDVEVTRNGKPEALRYVVR